MNLRKVEKEYHELPRWIEYYKRDTFSPYNKIILIVDIKAKSIAEVVLYKFGTNNYYAGLIVFNCEDKPASQVINFCDFANSPIFEHLNQNINENTIGDVMHTLTTRLTNDDSELITFSSTKPGFISSNYLIQKFFKE